MRSDKQNRIARVLFNEDIDKQDPSALDPSMFREWKGSADTPFEQFNQMVVHWAIRQRGGISEPTRCRVLVSTWDMLARERVVLATDYLLKTT